MSRIYAASFAKSIPTCRPKAPTTRARAYRSVTSCWLTEDEWKSLATPKTTRRRNFCASCERPQEASASDEPAAFPTRSGYGGVGGAGGLGERRVARSGGAHERHGRRDSRHSGCRRLACSAAQFACGLADRAALDGAALRPRDRANAAALGAEADHRLGARFRFQGVAKRIIFGRDLARDGKLHARSARNEVSSGARSARHDTVGYGGAPVGRENSSRRRTAARSPGAALLHQCDLYSRPARGGARARAGIGSRGRRIEL